MSLLKYFILSSYTPDFPPNVCPLATALKKHSQYKEPETPGENIHADETDIHALFSVCEHPGVYYDKAAHDADEEEEAQEMADAPPLPLPGRKLGWLVGMVCIVWLEDVWSDGGCGGGGAVDAEW